VAGKSVERCWHRPSPLRLEAGSPETLRVHKIPDFHLQKRIPKSEEAGNKSTDDGNGNHSNILGHGYSRDLRLSGILRLFVNAILS
jgi:hypothetical protein